MIHGKNEKTFRYHNTLRNFVPYFATPLWFLFYHNVTQCFTQGYTVNQLCDTLGSPFLCHRVTQCLTQSYTVKLLCETLCSPFLGHRVAQCLTQCYTVKTTL